MCPDLQLKLGRLLSLVRVLRTCINMQFAEYGATQRVFRQHAFDCIPDYTLRVCSQQFTQVD